MVDETLTSEMIKAGAALTERMDKAHIDVRASLWMYSADISAWRLILAIPGVSKEGPKKIYRKIQTALIGMKSDFPSLTLSHIAITPPDSSLIRVLRSAVTTGPGISGIRFSRDTIDGTYIEDSYIYRLVAREVK